MLASERAFGALLPLLSYLSIESQLVHITTAFEEAATHTLGKTKPREKRRPGMTPKVLRLRKAFQKAQHFHRASPKSVSIKRRFDRARHAYEEAFQEALSKSDVVYMGILCNEQDGQVWRGLTAYTGKKYPPLYPPLGGGHAITNKQKAHALLIFLSKVCAHQTDDDPRWDASFTKHVREYLALNDFDFNDLAADDGLNSGFTMHELNLAIDKLKHSSPGCDGMPSWFFKKSGDVARQCILVFVNTSFSIGILPDACKHGDIVPIPKPGRDHTQEKNYRPISLLLIISRLMESMIHRRLYYWSESNSHIPSTQAAYRSYSNSVHPLLRLTQDISSAFNTDKQTFAVRLDLKKAFDSVNGEYLCFVVHRMGLRGRMLAWVRSFLTNRRYRVVRPSTTEYVDFGIGVPQGSGLSPLLFILFISECSHLLHCSHAEYADDITLWYSHSCAHTIRAMLNEDLRTIEAWASRMRLQFGDKNEYFVFYPTQATALDIDSIGGLQFYSSNLTRAENFTLLGVHFDHGLTFGRHIQHIEASAKRRANMLRCVRASKLVKNSEALLVLYKGWIRPKIEYASEVYGTFAKTHANTLERVQALCLRTILGATQSTPHIILQNEASVSSLASRRRQHCLLTFMKILSLPQSHVLQEKLRYWWRRDSGFEGLMLKPSTFFGRALHAHYEVFECYPPRALPPAYTNPASLPPWSSVYTPPRKLDIHMQFRRDLRERTRAQQLRQLRLTHSASWYNALHPTSRRVWMRCLPTGGVLLRIITRLRTGYTSIGAMLPYLPETRCPGCGAVDSVEHLLFSCISHFAARELLFNEVTRLTDQPVTITLLLGFSCFVSNEVLRAITTATARFVVSAKRWP